MYQKREYFVTSCGDRLRVKVRREDKIKGRREKIYFPHVYSRLRLERILSALGPKDIWFRIDGPALVYQRDRFIGKNQPALF